MNRIANQLKMRVSWAVVSILAASTASAQNRRPSSMEAVSTTSYQNVPAGAVVTPSPAVLVRDQRGDPLPGESVAFTVQSGGGTVAPTMVTTDANGRATLTTWRLGNNPGSNSVAATLGNINPVTFGATGILVPTTMQAASPTNMTWSASAAVPQPPAVTIRDQFGTVMANTSVAFAVTAGGGTIAPASVSTGTDGAAKLTTWTLGPDAGVNKVRASSGNLSPVEFTATSPFMLVVFTKNPDGTRLPDTQICIGSATDIDQYATVKSGGSVGRATFTLPAAAEYRITVSKLTYVGRQVVLPAPQPLGNSLANTVSLSPGSGGPICPGAALQADATESVALPPTPLPDLDVKLSQTSTSIVAGAQQTYAMKIHNRGAGAASGVVFRATLPSDLTFVSHRADHSFQCTRSGTTFNCPSGAILSGDSATITVVMQLPGTATSGHDILLTSKVDPDNGINESNETNNQAAAAATTVAAARLGEETLSSHGLLDPVRIGERGVKTLDCKGFGTAFVMVGIEAITSEQINHIRVLCSPMQSSGSLSTSLSRTEFFFSSQSQPNSVRKCPAGSAVKAIAGSLRNGRLISLTLTCQQVVASGLTANTLTPLTATNTPGPDSWGAESCTGNRPARALKVGASAIEGLIAPLWVVGVQMICEQPIIP